MLLDAIMEVTHHGVARRRASSREVDESGLAGVPVLLAEDNEANRFVAEEILTRAGIALDFAANGQEALDKVRERRYGAVLMDMQMPVMDGLEATRRIRRAEAESGRRTPILAMTANAMKADLDLCLAAGMDDHVPKPIDRRVLFDKLRRWVAADVPRVETAPRAPGATPATSHTVAAIEGFDVEEATRRLGVPRVAYVRMLVRFAPGARESLAELAAAVAAGDRVAAARHAHSLAGAAGSFGAKPLHAACKALEQAARDATGDLAALGAEVAAAAEPVLRSIARLGGDGEPHAVGAAVEGATGAASGPPADPTALRSALVALGESLAASDLSGAAERLAAVEALATAWGPDLATLHQLIDDYRCEDAAARTGALLARLGSASSG
jgi:two-component system sensor histidine kinase/response regulator